MRRIWVYVVPVVLGLVLVSVIMARPFGVWMAPPDEPNAVEMQYGGTVRIEIVGQAVRPAAEDPNVLVLTIRLRVSE
jgi:hypothetical protein